MRMYMLTYMYMYMCIHIMCTIVPMNMTCWLITCICTVRCILNHITKEYFVRLDGRPDLELSNNVIIIFWLFKSVMFTCKFCQTLIQYNYTINVHWCENRRYIKTFFLIRFYTCDLYYGTSQSCIALFIRVASIFSEKDNYERSLVEAQKQSSKVHCQV